MFYYSATFYFEFATDSKSVEFAVIISSKEGCFLDTALWLKSFPSGLSGVSRANAVDYTSCTFTASSTVRSSCLAWASSIAFLFSSAILCLSASSS